MNSSNSLEIRDQKAVSPASAHVVYALSAAERRLFLPAWDKDFLDAEQTWIDAERKNTREWEELLNDLQPSVLVTGWSCPPIPQNWALEKNCPLRYVCSITGSVKGRVSRKMLESGILVSNWGNLISHTVAEHALLLTLASLRNMRLWPELMAEPVSICEMMPLLKSRTLRGKRVGLHGFGAIAREIVSMLRPHQVEISAYSQGVPEAFFHEYGVKACESLSELFHGSDILIECEGLNSQSKGLVTREILELLPQDAVFINVGRGLVVDEDALAGMAAKGRLRVGLDVYHREPLSKDSPLFNNAGVILSPHVAGPTSDTYPLCGLMAMENVGAFLKGEQPEYLVNLEAYDRAT